MSEFPSFILLNNIPFYVHTTLCLSFFCWWTPGLPPLIIANNAATNMGIHVFLCHLALNSPRGGIAISYSNQLSSVAQSCLTLCKPMDCSTPGFPVHHQLLELSDSYASSWWCHPTIPSSIVPFSSHLQSFPASGSFSSESFLCIRWPKYWSFSFSVSPSNEHSGLSFRMDWFDPLAVQGTLKSPFQHHSSKASVLQHSAFFMVQLSHPYTTTGKTITLTRWTFAGKVTSLLFNMLWRFVIAFLPRSI